MMMSRNVELLMSASGAEAYRLRGDGRIKTSKLLLAISRSLRLSQLSVWPGASREAREWLRLTMFLVVRTLGQGAYLSWGRRVLRLAYLKQRLLTTSAYVSTLGGGYFLCKFVNQAKTMAARQYMLAKCLNDTPLEIQCCIHMAYSLIREGKWAMASSIINYQMARCALVHNNHEITSVVKSAKRFLRKIRKTSTMLKRIKVREPNVPCQTTTLSHGPSKIESIAVVRADNFQRHHIVESV